MKTNETFTLSADEMTATGNMGTVYRAIQIKSLCMLCFFFSSKKDRCTLTGKQQRELAPCYPNIRKDNQNVIWKKQPETEEIP